MSIDLNIDHYTNEELMTLLRIEPGYTLENIEQKEFDFYLQIMQTIQDIPTKQNITIFLKAAKQRLITLFHKSSLFFIVDSIHKSYHTKTNDFVYFLPEPMMVKTLKITHIDMPCYWNDYTNAYFYYNQLQVFIPDGNYSSSEMEALIPKLVDVKISIRSHTIFYSTNVFSIEFGKGFKTAGWYMGFRNEKYTSEYNATTSRHEIKSEAPYGCLTEYMTVEVYDYQEMFTTDMNYVGKSKHTLALFPVINQQRINHDSFPLRIYQEPVKLERLRIRLFDKFGEPFLLKTNFSITFLLKTV